MSDLIRKELQEAQKVLEVFASNEATIREISEASLLLSNALNNGKKIISCGNGGSMSDAMHFAEEMTGRFRGDRPPFAAIAISDPAYLTCTANDYGFDEVFARFIEGNGTEGDILLTISTSGNSENVVRAAKSAQKKGLKVIALTGKDGGKLSTMCDVEIRAPYSKFADRVQEIHIKVIHILIHLVEQKLLE